MFSILYKSLSKRLTVNLAGNAEIRVYSGTNLPVGHPPMGHPPAGQPPAGQPPAGHCTPSMTIDFFYFGGNPPAGHCTVYNIYGNTFFLFWWKPANPPAGQPASGTPASQSVLREDSYFSLDSRDLKSVNLKYITVG